MTVNNGRYRVSLLEELRLALTNPRELAPYSKKGLMVLLARFGIVCGLIAVFYSDWLSGRVVCAAQFYRDERIYLYGLIGYGAVVASSLLWLGVYIVQIQKTGLRSTAPPILQGHWVWMWWTLIICGCLAGFVILHTLLRMC